MSNIPPAGSSKRDIDWAQIWRDLERDAAIRDARTLAITDPAKLIDHLRGWPYGHITYYHRVLDLIADEPSAGIRDLLLGRARDVLGTTIRSMRQDLQSLAEVRALEWMAAAPTRTPRTGQAS